MERNNNNETININIQEILREIQSLKKNKLILSLTKKNKIQVVDLPPQSYMNESLNDLLITSLYILQQFQEKLPPKKVRLDDWYVQAFLLFPHRFVLSARWPIFLHSEKMTKRWRDLRSQGLIRGEAKQGFTVTTSGIKIVKETWERIKQKTDNLTKDAAPIILNFSQNKSKYETTLLKPFEKQKIFRAWNEQETLPHPISMYELARLLKISSTSSIRTYEKRFAEYLRNGGELDVPDPRFIKARKFLVLQAIYRKEYFGSTLSILLDKLIEELNLEKLAEEAEQIIVDD